MTQNLKSLKRCPLYKKKCSGKITKHQTKKFCLTLYYIHCRNYNDIIPLNLINMERIQNLKYKKGEIKGICEIDNKLCPIPRYPFDCETCSRYLVYILYGEVLEQMW